MVREEYKETKLGEIPEEWDVSKFRDVTNYISYGFTNPMPESNEGPYLITAKDIERGRIQYQSA